jgi:hypothetical protein
MLEAKKHSYIRTNVELLKKNYYYSNSLVWEFELKKFVLFITTTLLISCGGGGSSGSGAISSFDTTNAVLMEPTFSNATKLANIVQRNPQDQYSLNAVMDNQGTNILPSIVKMLDTFKETHKTEQYAINRIIKGSEPCEDGGFLTANGSVNSNNGSAVLNYQNCDEGGIVMNGSAIISVWEYLEDYDDYSRVSTNFVSDFTMTNNSGEITTILARSSAFINNLDFDYYWGAIEMDMKVTAFYIENGITYGQENSNIYFNRENISRPYFYYKSGRFYIDNLEKYAEYDTSYDMSYTPFRLDLDGDLRSGEAWFTMANGGRAAIKDYFGGIQVELDTDGDGYSDYSQVFF